MLQKIANTIRHLTMDVVELTGSGHPGIPMGCAELGAYLFGEFLRFDPVYLKWSYRDRLIFNRRSKMPYTSGLSEIIGMKKHCETESDI